MRFLHLLLGVAITLAAPVRAVEPSPPRTAEEHLAAAKSYKDQADGARRSAELHRTMIDRALTRAQDRGQRHPGERQDKWYLDHCRRLADQANALATTATEMAAYHEKKAGETGKKSARTEAPAQTEGTK